MRAVVAVVTAVVVAVGGLTGPAYAAPVTGTVQGTYTTDAGEPIAGASVYSNSPEYNSWQRLDTTDAQGRYRLYDVPAGPFTLHFRLDGVSQYAPRTIDQAAATWFTMVPGLTLTIDERQIPTGTAGGRLTTAGGDPVNRAIVSVVSVIRTPWGGTNQLARTFTDADGRWTVPAVAAGQVRFQFTVGGVSQWAGGATDFDSAATYTITAGGSVTVDEARFPTGTITGQLTGPDGDPVETFTAAADRVDGSGSISARFTGDDGRYTLEVPAGQWRVRFLAGLTVPVPAAGGAALTVAAGQTVRADGVVPATGSIGGRLVEADGEPLRERPVQLWRSGVQVASTYAYEDGEYAFEAVPAGDYLVRTRWGSTWFYLPGVALAEDATPFTVRVGENTRADGRTPALGSLAGTLTLPGGAPAAGLTVRTDAVAPDVQVHEATTGPDGTWRMTSIFPGDYRVTFTGADKAVTQAAGVVAVAAGATSTVDDTWRTGASVTVTATDAETGEPVGDFCVSAAERHGSTCAGEDTGTVTVAGLRPGVSTFTVTPGKSSNYVPAGEIRVSHAADAHESVTVPLTIGGRFNTRVIDRVTGAPIHRACVALVAPGAGGITEVIRECTNKQGKLTTWARPPGTYQMFVEAPSGHGAQWVTETGGSGDQREATTFRVRPGKTVKTGDVPLDRAGTVTGVVRDPAGRPVAGVNVGVTAWGFTLGPEYPGVETDSQGRYSISTLGPYAWPLLFTPAHDLPRQWSGGVANRFRAETVTVTAGTSTAYDVTLRAGSRLTGTVTIGDGSPAYTGGSLLAVNAATGDHLAVTGFPGTGGTYDLPVIGGNPVKLAWRLASPTAGASGWWADGETVAVPATGVRNQDLRLP